MFPVFFYARCEILIKICCDSIIYFLDSFSSCIAATEATAIKAGRCQAEVPAKLARLLYRHSEARGEHGMLSWSEFEQEYKPTLMKTPTVELDALITSLPWESPLGYRFVNLAHINVQECKAVLDDLQRQVANGLHNKRIIVAIDSRVCVGAIGIMGDYTLG